MRSCVFGLTAAVLAGGAEALDGPCDIYAEGGQTCVAAHSMTRSLYGAYIGPLYSLVKSGGTTKDIHPKSAGGVADGAAHDAFCGSTSACHVGRIYVSAHAPQLAVDFQGRFCEVCLCFSGPVADGEPPRY